MDTQVDAVALGVGKPAAVWGHAVWFICNYQPKSGSTLNTDWEIEGHTK